MLSPGGTPNLTRLLKDNRNLGGWTFIPGQYLNAVFSIGDYYPCVPDKQCAGFDFYDSDVGATIEVKYQPASPDEPSTNLVNWIQRVWSNHGSVLDVHGVEEDRIDSEGPEFPFYAPLDFNDPSYFNDTPGREDNDQSHWWNAELFLVVPRTATRVEIYDGMSWGWKNSVTRVKKQQLCAANYVLVGKDCVPPVSWGEFCIHSTTQKEYPIYDSSWWGQFGYGCDWRPSYSDNSARMSQMSLTEPDSDSVSTKDFRNAASVPEPSAMGTLLAVGVWGGVSWRKRKQRDSESTSRV
jgi:hypothetical protein